MILCFRVLECDDALYPKEAVGKLHFKDANFYQMSEIIKDDQFLGIRIFQNNL